MRAGYWLVIRRYSTRTRRDTEMCNGCLVIKMPTLKDLHKLYLSKLETTLQESGLLLQKQEGGLDGELKTSGWICEQLVRQTLQKFIVPGQFRLTTGFIATPELTLCEAILRIEAAACYFPHRTHTLASWWHKAKNQKTCSRAAESNISSSTPKRRQTR